MTRRQKAFRSRFDRADRGHGRIVRHLPFLPNAPKHDDNVFTSLLALALIGLMHAGCGAFSPRADPSRFFTLSTSAELQALARDAGNPEGISVGIGPIKFPGYLDRQEIMFRTAQNRFEVLENDRWAEPLDENFTRVISQNLSGLLRTDRIIVYPWTSDRKPTYQVEIEVLRFEGNSARDAQLSVRWGVIDGNSKKRLTLKESRLTRPAKEKSTDGTVAALSETAEDLSREIAEALGALEGRQSKKKVNSKQ
jgi:uncharacterized lipoprotein YmbA